MFWLTVVALFVLKPEPGPVTVSAADRERALALVTSLGSDSFLERDQAQRDLWTMGRHALPALRIGTGKDPDPEVRRRCELLVPRAEALDFEARMAAFLADPEEKYHHVVPGWDRFRTLTGNEPAAREFYVEMLRSKGNRPLLEAIDLRDENPTPPIVDAALVGPLAFVSQPKRGQLAQRLVNRKQELYQKMNPRGFNGRSSYDERYEPTAEDSATILFCDTLQGDSGAAVVVGVRVATPSLLMSRTRARSGLESERTGPVMKKLLLAWLGSRTSGAGLYQGVLLIQSLSFKEGLSYAGKLVAMEGASTLHRATAAVAISKIGDKDDAKYLVPAMTDATLVRNVAGGGGEIQLRDVALAQAANLVGHSPEAFGLRGQSTGDYARYYYWNYSFASDAEREKGFAKWAELEPKLKPVEVKK